MSKPDLIGTYNAELARGVPPREAMATVREVRAYFDKVDPPAKPEQQQQQLDLAAPPAIAPQVDPQPPVRSGVLDDAAAAAPGNRKKRHWTDRELARVKALFEYGSSKQEIADIMGRTVKAVEAILSNGKIKPYNYRPNKQRQESGRKSAISRGFTLRNGAASPHGAA